MTVSWVAALLTGCFGIVGVIGGAALTAVMNSRIERRKRSYDDDRRWLTDRRQLYARYLTLCEGMLRDIDGVACFLKYDESKPPRYRRKTKSTYQRACWSTCSDTTMTCSRYSKSWSSSQHLTLQIYATGWLAPSWS